MKRTERDTGDIIFVDRGQEARDKCQWMLHHGILQMALNMHWHQHMNNQELYGSFPRVSETICERTLGLAGHSTCHNEETPLKVLLREPQKCCLRAPKWSPNQGRPRTTHIDTTKADTRLDNTEETTNLMAA